MTRLDLPRLEPLSAHRAALELVWSALPQARLVGGVVRDLLAGAAIADLDLATPEPPQIVLRRLQAAGIRAIATGLAHGTVTALAPGQPIEITTLRRDQRTDGRHAEVAWTADWHEDAARRDFTINAMSLSRDGTLFDPFAGAADLAAGRVRFVGDPALRIAEDRLRMLRFFRFQARYGIGAPEAAALAAIARATPGLDALSPERVWSELRRILTGPALAATVASMAATGVLDRLLPGGVRPQRLAGLLSAGLPCDAVLRLAALIEAPAPAVAARLRLSNAEAADLAAFLALPPPSPEMDDAQVRRLLADTPSDLLSGRSWLAQAASQSEAAAWNRLRDRLAGTTRPVFPLAGRDVLDLGVPPGPRVGELLAGVRGWWLDQGCIADRDACLFALSTALH